MNIPKLILCFFMLSVLFFSSCKESIEKDKLIIDENELSEDIASAIARNILWREAAGNSDQGVNTTKTSSSEVYTKEIESIHTAPTDGYGSAFYIINYKGGGFLILAADKRSQPILAYSETNSFPIDDNVYPSGLVDWLSGYKECIEFIRQTNPESNEFLSKTWENLSKTPINSQKIIEEDNIQTRAMKPEEPVSYSYYEKTLDFKTKWGQDCGYNSLLSAKCDNPMICYKPPVGCVATAMAQVMKYHKHPATYNWDNMPDGNGNNTIAALMRDIGRDVGMKYGCNGSKAEMKDAVKILKKYGYSRASLKEYSFFEVTNEITRGNPVILAGGRDSGWWIFGNYTDGHAWVCEGYNMEQIGALGYWRLRMNWGWRGRFDGWYSAGNFNIYDPKEEKNHSFNYKTRMIVHITL